MIIIVGYNIGVITSSFLFSSEVKGKKKKRMREMFVQYANLVCNCLTYCTMLNSHHLCACLPSVKQECVTLAQ